MESKNLMAQLNVIKGWTQSDLVEFLNKNSMEEYVTFAESKELDGFKFLSLSEGVIAMWRPKVDAKKLIAVIEVLKHNPQKYLNKTNENAAVQITNDLTGTQNEGLLKNIQKKSKPKVPVRTDSLKKYNKNLQDENETQSKIIDEPKISQNTITEEINLEKMTPPKSFLYSTNLRNAVFRLSPYPYVPMENNVNTVFKRSQDDVIIRKKSNIDFENEEKEILDDRGYYEMSARKSWNNPTRRFSDGYIKQDENPYEELLFKNQNGNTDDKKKLGILRRVLKRPTFKREKINLKDESQKTCQSKDTASSANSSPQRLTKINERVKKLSPKMGNNYKLNNVQNINNIIEENVVISVKFKQFGDNFDDTKTKFETVTEIKETDANNKAIDAAEESLEVNSTSLYHARMIDVDPKQDDLLFQTNEAFYEEPDYSLSNNNSNRNSRSINCDHVYELAEPFADISREDDITFADSKRTSIEVEDYLEPIQCIEPSAEAVMDNLAEEMMKLFDASMEMKEIRKDQVTFIEEELTFQDIEDRMPSNNRPKPPISKKPQTSVPIERQPKPKIPSREIDQDSSKNIKDQEDIEGATSNYRAFEILQRWNEPLKNNAKRKKEAIKKTMIDRPLPVPVENEFYYMEIGRIQAERLLEGHADGTFILRPSSQSPYLYAVTLIYQGRIYNIGCRRRDDGRLALGFSKAGEQSFLSITQLIQHYYKERLVIFQDGARVGCTTLRNLH